MEAAVKVASDVVKGLHEKYGKDDAFSVADMMSVISMVSAMLIIPQYEFLDQKIGRDAAHELLEHYIQMLTHEIHDVRIHVLRGGGK